MPVYSVRNAVIVDLHVNLHVFFLVPLPYLDEIRYCTIVGITGYRVTGMTGEDNRVHEMVGMPH